MATLALKPSKSWCTKCIQNDARRCPCVAIWLASLTIHSNQLAGSLSALSNSAFALPTQLPPEVVEYVDEGRNPDIYSREFVELVQKGNQELKGKAEAFSSFRDILGEEIIRAMPELKDHVSHVAAGGLVEEIKKENGEMEGGPKQVH